MATFAEAVLAASARTLSVGVHTEVSAAIGMLGIDAHRRLAEIPPERRVFLADQFVRNLKSLAVDRAVDVERELFRAVGAQPAEEWRLGLAGPQSVLELRNQMKVSLTALGLSWSAIARLQASVCMLATWILESGGGTVHIQTTEKYVRFRIVTFALGGDASLLADTPMVGALRAQVSNASAVSANGEIALEFTVSLKP